MRDYYSILGINRDASENDIKKAYRKRAVRYYPNKGITLEDEKKFIEAAEAYDVLMDGLCALNAA